MGQIQSAIGGAVRDAALATVGKGLIKQDLADKAFASAERATKALDEYKKAEDERAAANATENEAKKARDDIVKRYGLKIGYMEDGSAEILEPPGNKLSSNEKTRRRQLNRAYDAKDSYEKAITANRYAKEAAEFRYRQYDAFAKRAKELAGKAGVEGIDEMLRLKEAIK